MRTKHPHACVAAMERKPRIQAAVIVRVAAGVVLLAAAVLALVVLPTRDFLIATLEWLTNLGPLGPVALAGIYILAAVLLVPGTILTLGAGFAFGVLWGTVAASAGSTLGATAAFLLGRTLARRFIEDRVARRPVFAAIDRAVAREGFRIVLLTRLSPIFPFNLLNYAYGLTHVSLRDYVLASWIGMLPATVLYAYLGSAAKSLADLAVGRIERTPAQGALFAFGLAATIIATVYVARTARKELQKSIRDGAA